MLTIWHNPRCSKSRQTLALIEAAGAEVTVRRYLEDAPSLSEIKTMQAQLGLSDPREMMRKGEAIYKELKLKDVEGEALLDAMAADPILIERPIVSNGTRAIMGRPPTNLETLL